MEVARKYFVLTGGIGAVCGMTFGFGYFASIGFPGDILLVFLTAPVTIPLYGIVGFIIGPFVPPMLIVLGVVMWFKDRNKNKSKRKNLNKI